MTDQPLNLNIVQNLDTLKRDPTRKDMAMASRAALEQELAETRQLLIGFKAYYEPQRQQMVQRIVSLMVDLQWAGVAVAALEEAIQNASH